MNPARPTNDHYVPQMYLKRWGTPRPAGHQIIAAHADDLSSPFPTTTRNVASEKGFYWGEDHDGVPHHEMERFLTTLENDAATAFRFILDKGSRPADNALPPRWPTRADDRLMLAWWIAAQLLRTTHQRERLWKLTGDPLEPPRSMARANKHFEFMLENIGPLAGIIFRRPWGIGFSSACLM